MNEDEKLKRLAELIQEYVKYLKHYSEAKVEKNNDMIKVTYQKPRTNVYLFQSIEFPTKDMDDRIIHYRNKINYFKEKLQKTE